MTRTQKRMVFWGVVAVTYVVFRQSIFRFMGLESSNRLDTDHTYYFSLGLNLVGLCFSIFWWARRNDKNLTLTPQQFRVMWYLHGSLVLCFAVSLVVVLATGEPFGSRWLAAPALASIFGIGFIRQGGAPE